MRLILVLVLIVIMLIAPVFMGRWCRYNTELLIFHYQGKEVILPNWPFILGAYLTQCGLPYGIVTEIWAQVKDLK